MTSWAVLLLTLVLLGTPGLAFSGLTPEHSALARAHPCDGEQFCQNLAPEDPQGDQLLQREELGLICESCRKIIQKLEDMVGPQPNEDTVTQAASRVCDKMKILRGVCKKIMRTFLRRISKDILTGKKPQAICVDIKICKEKTDAVIPPCCLPEDQRTTVSFQLLLDDPPLLPRSSHPRRYFWGVRMMPRRAPKCAPKKITPSRHCRLYAQGQRPRVGRGMDPKPVGLWCLCAEPAVGKGWVCGIAQRFQAQSAILKVDLKKPSVVLRCCIPKF
uniref:Granulysin n=1 Tax=Sus scrofa TaxID=9823 RepID=A0A8D1YNL8_PIG